jgi:WD40 repeat protein
MSLGQETVPRATQDYADTIANAQAALDAGRIAEAQQKLEATEESLRGFEYDYLVARAEAAPAEGPAPTLIQTVDVPEVDTRFGVLNGVDRQLVFICRDGGLRIHDLGNPEAPAKVVMHEGAGAVWNGAFSADGKTFVAGFQKGEVVAWDAQTWEQRFTASLGEKPVRELAVAPDGSTFVAEGESALELWSLADGEPTKIAEVGDRYNFGEGLAFSPKGDLIATGGMFDILLFDAKTGEQTRSMTHASYTMGLEFSPDGERIASAPRGNVNKFLAVFDVEDGEMQFNAGPFDCYVHGGIFTSDGKRIVSTACEKVPSLQLFDSATGALIFSLDRKANGAQPAVTDDGRLLGWSEAEGYQFIDLKQKQNGDK